MIAEKQGENEVAFDYLTRAFDLMKDPKPSETYYNFAYQTVHLPTDLAPF